MSWNAAVFPEKQKKSNIVPIFRECEWSDPGNRLKKGNVTSASQCGIVGNILCWANKDSFDEIKRFFW